MNKHIFIVVGILVASIGTGGCAQPQDAVRIGPDGETSIEETSENEGKFDFETYNSWQKPTQWVYDYQMDVWQRYYDEEMKPSCTEQLPEVEIVEEGCWEGAGGCYLYNPSKSLKKVVVLADERSFCHDVVGMLYHEFMHHHVVCNYGTMDHLPKYFVEDIEERISEIQEEICNSDRTVAGYVWDM